MAGYKTVIVAVVQFLIYALAWDQLVLYVDPQTIAYIGVGLMLLLRVLTNTAIFSKRGEE